MELRQYRYFVALAEELHFGRAAARVSISQPALSKQIRELEREVDALLVWRTKREVRLTPAGAAFLRNSRELLNRVDHSVAEARSIGRGDLGSIEIGYMSATSARLMPRVVRAFRRRYPRVEVRLRLLIPPTHFEMIRNTQVDFGFILSPPAGEGLKVLRLVEDPLIVALPEGHKLASRSRIPLSALHEEPFVFYPRHASPETYDQTMGFLRRAGARVNVVLEAFPIYGLLAAAAAGMGVSLVPECMRDVRPKGVVYRPVAGATPKLPWSLAFAPRVQNGVQKAFLEVVRELYPSPRRGRGS